MQWVYDVTVLKCHAAACLHPSALECVAGRLNGGISDEPSCRKLPCRYLNLSKIPALKPQVLERRPSRAVAIAGSTEGFPKLAPSSGARFLDISSAGRYGANYSAQSRYLS